MSLRRAHVLLSGAMGLMPVAPLLPALAAPSAVLAQPSDTIVRVAGKPAHAGIATLVRELSIGVTSGSDEYMFGEVGDVAVARDGSVLVYDRQARIVRQYDATGRHLRNFGRAGQGPGEYRTVSGIGILPDGRVLVWDTAAWRLNVYAPDGTVLATWSTASGMSSGAVSSSARALMVDTSGVIWLRRRGPLDRARLASGPEFYERRRATDGSVIDSIAQPPFPHGERQLTATDPAGRARHTSDLPFGAPTIWRASPLGYLVTAIPDRYALELLVPASAGTRAAPATWRPGQPIISVRRDVKPEPVTRAERDSARSEVLASMRRLDPAWSWSGPEIPAMKPAFRDITFGLDGRIWIPVVPELTPRLGTVSGPGGAGSGSRPPMPSRIPVRDPPPPRPALYDVFEPDGRYLGQVRIPPRTTVAVRRGDNVWAIVFDDDDVARVERYRIAWP